MTFTGPLRSTPPQPYRSKLFVPGSQSRFFAKAAASAADAICLDLEDSVAPADKEAARANVAQALHEIDWGKKQLSCRINGLDTVWWYRDVVALAEQGGERLDAIMLPKANSGADVHAVDVLALQAARGAGRERPIELEVQIETPQGVLNLRDIASSTPRLASLHFGHADYAASIGMRTLEIGGDSAAYATLGEANGEGVRPRFGNDTWHYPLIRMVTAARAYGLLAIEGPYGNVADLEGLEIYAKRAACLGCSGKWAIHPTQIPIINTAFAPTPEEIAEARAVLAALANAQAAGRGAVTRDGVLLDRVTVRQAEHIIALAGG